VNIKRSLKSYLGNESGNFAMMFAVLSVPLLIAVGMAIDISRAQSFHSKLQDAADVAVLQASVLTSLSEDDLEIQARRIFDANLYDVDVQITEFDLTEDQDGDLSVRVRGNIPAMFAKVGGYPKLNVTIGSDAEADAGEDLELVIAFDTTSSMGFGTTWTTALDTLDNVLDEIDQYSGTNNFFVSLVPFSDRVNVGTSRTDWLTGAAPINWNGCVEPREENQDGVTWALDDNKPTDGDRFDASIVGVTGGLVGFNSGFPYCPNVAITGPTSDVDDIITAAGTFSKSGTGRFDVAMAWVWRLMSSEWRGHWNSGGHAAADATDRRQIAIMVTDGKTEAYTWEVDQTSSWGWNNGSVGGFENMVRVCDDMKDDDMEIFMIRVNGNPNAASYMQDCASTDEHYYEITDNADLELAFKEVLKVVKENVILVH
jgi:hypothetical protein